jgi:hypothetical protein
VVVLAFFAGCVVVGLGMILVTVCKIRPVLFKITAALWKIFTFSVEIRSPRQRPLPGKHEDDEWPDL